MFNTAKARLFGLSEERLRQQEEIEYVRDRVLRKFPLLGTTMAHLKTTPAKRIGGESIDTAATDGKTIFYNPDWFMALPDDEKVFVYAHEVMHVAFNHILRSGNRNHKLWNKATDSVINQMLKSESLPMPEHGVDIAEALQHSAEEMYEKLLQEKEDKKKEKQEKGQGGEGQPDQSDQNDGDSDDDDDENEQAGHDNHNIWKEVVKQADYESAKQRERERMPRSEASETEKERSEQKKNKSESASAKASADKQDKEQSEQMSRQSQQNKQTPDGDRNTSENQGGAGDTNGDQPEFDKWNPQNEAEFEKGFERENRRERTHQAEQAQRQLDIEKNRSMDAVSQDSGRTFGAVGKSDAVMDWKRILKKTIEEERDKWSYRRSDADNDFMARVEEEDDDDRAETEVMLDVSGSVSDSFLREFLRQLKPLLKNGKLRVGCFDERFYGLVEVKSDADIDNFKIIAKSRWTENWDLAVKSFSKKNDINKIVFTDGWPGPGNMPDESTRNVKNLIWLVYGNPNFHPVSGKVIQVNPRTIEQHFTMPRTVPDKSR